MESLQGQLLIATPRLFDPNFFKSIILVIQHGKEGALGLVLNRPLELSIQSAWEQISEGACAVEGFIHQGGPCEGPLMVLHAEDDLSQMQVLPGVHFCTDREMIRQLISRADRPMKFFVGYAGWAPGQLEGEMNQASWISLPASSEFVFKLPEDPWQLLMDATRSAGLGGINPKGIPEDPSTN